MGYLDAALTEEQIVEKAEARATTDLGIRRVMNSIMREENPGPEFERARRRVNKLERANGELSPLEYAYAIHHELTDIVNEKYR